MKSRIQLLEIVKVIISVVLINILYAIFLFYWVREGDLNGINSNISGVEKLIALFYFSLTTFTTTGYGDITPATPRMRIVNSVFVVSVLSGLISYTVNI